MPVIFQRAGVPYLKGVNNSFLARMLPQLDEMLGVKRWLLDDFALRPEAQEARVLVFKSLGGATAIPCLQKDSLDAQHRLLMRALLKELGLESAEKLTAWFDRVKKAFHKDAADGWEEAKKAFFTENTCFRLSEFDSVIPVFEVFVSHENLAFSSASGDVLGLIENLLRSEGATLDAGGDNLPVNALKTLLRDLLPYLKVRFIVDALLPDGDKAIVVSANFEDDSQRLDFVKVDLDTASPKVLLSEEHVTVFLNQYLVAGVKPFDLLFALHRLEVVEGEDFLRFLMALIDSPILQMHCYNQIKPLLNHTVNGKRLSEYLKSIVEAINTFDWKPGSDIVRCVMQLVGYFHRLNFPLPKPSEGDSLGVYYPSILSLMVFLNNANAFITALTPKLNNQLKTVIQKLRFAGLTDKNALYHFCQLEREERIYDERFMLYSQASPRSLCWYLQKELRALPESFNFDPTKQHVFIPFSNGTGAGGRFNTAEDAGQLVAAGASRILNSLALFEGDQCNKVSLDPSFLVWTREACFIKAVGFEDGRVFTLQPDERAFGIKPVDVTSMQSADDAAQVNWIFSPSVEGGVPSTLKRFMTGGVHHTQASIVIRLDRATPDGLYLVISGMPNALVFADTLFDVTLRYAAVERFSLGTLRASFPVFPAGDLVSLGALPGFYPAYLALQLSRICQQSSGDPRKNALVLLSRLSELSPHNSMDWEAAEKAILAKVSAVYIDAMGNVSSRAQYFLRIYGFIVTLATFVLMQAYRPVSSDPFLALFTSEELANLLVDDGQRVMLFALYLLGIATLPLLLKPLESLVHLLQYAKQGVSLCLRRAGYSVWQDPYRLRPDLKQALMAADGVYLRPGKLPRLRAALEVLASAEGATEAMQKLLEFITMCDETALTFSDGSHDNRVAFARMLSDPGSLSSQYGRKISLKETVVREMASHAVSLLTLVWFAYAVNAAVKSSGLVRSLEPSGSNILDLEAQLALVAFGAGTFANPGLALPILVLLLYTLFKPEWVLDDMVTVFRAACAWGAGLASKSCAAFKGGARSASSASFHAGPRARAATLSIQEDGHAGENQRLLEGSQDGYGTVGVSGPSSGP